MDSEFRYNSQTVLMDSIDVEDIGNCALEAVDEDGCHYYLIIETVEGWSKVISWGPVIPDIKLLPTGFKSSYDYMKYADTKIQTLIKKWVLGGKGINFESVYQITKEDAISQHRSAIEPLLMKGDNNG